MQDIQAAWLKEYGSPFPLSIMQLEVRQRGNIFMRLHVSAGLLSHHHLWPDAVWCEVASAGTGRTNLGTAGTHISCFRRSKCAVRLLFLFFYILFFLFFFDCASCLRENLSPSGMIQVCSRNTYLLVQVYNTKGNPAIIDLKLVANGSVVMSE